MHDLTAMWLIWLQLTPLIISKRAPLIVLTVVLDIHPSVQLLRTHVYTHTRTHTSAHTHIHTHTRTRCGQSQPPLSFRQCLPFRVILSLSSATLAVFYPARACVRVHVCACVCVCVCACARVCVFPGLSSNTLCLLMVTHTHAHTHIPQLTASIFHTFHTPPPLQQPTSLPHTSHTPYRSNIPHPSQARL